MTEHEPEYDEISRLLADARVTEPLPAEVAGRLDDVLAGLVDSRETAATGAGDRAGDDAGDATVLPLGRPLGRRILPRLLAAAAAVVVVGGGAVGIDQLVGNDGSSATSGGSASHAADGAAGSSRTAGPQATTPQATSRKALTPSASAAPVAALTKRHFRAGVTTLLGGAMGAEARRPAATSGAEPRAPLARRTEAPLAGTEKGQPGCAAPAGVGKADVVYPVTFDGAPAVLVVRPVSAHRQTVAAYRCAPAVTAGSDSKDGTTDGTTNGTAQPAPTALASTTIPR